MAAPKILVRETMCGWNATSTRPSPASDRAACRSPAISLGWWA